MLAKIKSLNLYLSLSFSIKKFIFRWLFTDKQNCKDYNAKGFILRIPFPYTVRAFIEDKYGSKTQFIAFEKAKDKEEYIKYQTFDRKQNHLDTAS